MKQNRPFTEQLQNESLFRPKPKPTRRITYSTKGGKLLKVEKVLR